MIRVNLLGVPKRKARRASTVDIGQRLTLACSLILVAAALLVGWSQYRKLRLGFRGRDHADDHHADRDQDVPVEPDSRVTVPVTDDRGQTGNASLSVTPTFPATASFTVSPSSASVAGTTLSFNASATTVGSGTTIASYAWNFGDGTAAVTLATPTTTHVFAVAGTYVVRLTIADNLGRTATTTVAVVVQ